LKTNQCGTHALTASLWEHPLVAQNQYWELHFFDSDRPVRTEKGIDSFRSRQAYVHAFQKHSPEFFQRLNQEEAEDQKISKMIAMESSPRYLLNSDRLPHLILCVVPWVKFLVLLRDPISRVESQYRYLDEVRRKYEKSMVDWKTWIEDDLRLLTEAGVLNATTRDEERLAWKRYNRRPNSNQIVGRGIYVLQLLDYYEAMDYHQKPRSDLLVLQSERFRRHRQDVYNEVLAFLDLPPYMLQNSTEDIHPTLNKEQATPMPFDIRVQLQEVYQPYNRRLYELLGWNQSLVWG
jgi:hypothetical protein